MNRISIAPELVFCPQPMYIIGTRNEDGTPNFCTITWITWAWHGDPHIVLSIGAPKRTRENILRERTFSANLVSTDMVWLADYVGSSTGYDGPKNKVDYAWDWGQVIKVPVLAESRWLFECRVSKDIPLEGGHIFLGKVENIQIDARLEDMDRSKIDLKALEAAVYAPYGYYSVATRLGNMGEWAQHLQASE